MDRQPITAPRLSRLCDVTGEEEPELEMAAQAGGVAFQEKVSRLLRGGSGRPVLKPNKKLVLGDAVANRRLRKGGEDRSP